MPGKTFFMAAIQIGMHYIREEKIRNSILVVYKAFSTNSWSFVSLCHLAT